MLKTVPMDGKKPEVLLVSPILINPAYRDNVLFYDMFGDGAYERSLGFAKAYKAFAEANGLHYMDAAQYGEASTKDGVHMEPQYHERLGKAFAEKVREVLN